MRTIPSNRRLCFFSLKAVVAAALIVASSTSETMAEGFTGNKFLEWSSQSQRSYLQTSITMAGVIAAQGNADQARCVDDWHHRQSNKSYSEILKSIRKYSSYHPQGVVLAFLKKACGPLN